jgi:glycosyltransferase involved in cell wall biosynthesis
MGNVNLSYSFLAFNNWPVLEQTLNSAKNLKHTQGYPQWVIVDNSLPQFQDFMTEKIEEWVCRNVDITKCPVSHILNEQNTGEGGGMNQCFEACTGKYILFFQDDWGCVVDYNFIDFGIEILDTFEHIFMIQLGKRAWSTTNPNCRFERVLMPPRGNMVAIEMADNTYGNHTNQVKLFKKDKWLKIGPYFDMKTIPWERIKPGAREGSLVECEYGIRLDRLKMRAAKINDGQFIHLIPENARQEHFITK